MKTLYAELDEVMESGYPCMRISDLKRRLTIEQGAMIPGHRAVNDPLTAAELKIDRLRAALSDARREMMGSGFSEDGKVWEGDPAEEIVEKVWKIIDAVWFKEKLNERNLPFDGKEAERTAKVLAEHEKEAVEL